MVSLGYDQEYLWSDPELQRLLEPNGKNTKKVRGRRGEKLQRELPGVGWSNGDPKASIYRWKSASARPCDFVHARVEVFSYNRCNELWHASCVGVHARASAWYRFWILLAWWAGLALTPPCPLMYTAVYCLFASQLTPDCWICWRTSAASPCTTMTCPDKVWWCLEVFHLPSFVSFSIPFCLCILKSCISQIWTIKPDFKWSWHGFLAKYD